MGHGPQTNRYLRLQVGVPVQLVRVQPTIRSTWDDEPSLQYILVGWWPFLETEAEIWGVFLMHVIKYNSLAAPLTGILAAGSCTSIFHKHIPRSNHLLKLF